MGDHTRTPHTGTLSRNFLATVLQDAASLTNPDSRLPT